MSVLKSGTFFSDAVYYQPKRATLRWNEIDGYRLVIDDREYPITEQQAESDLLTHDLYLSDKGIKLAIELGVQLN